MEDETRRIKRWYFFASLFVVSGWVSCQEVKYTIWGRTAKAEITSVRKVADPSNFSTKDVIAVRYHWTDQDDGVREDIVNFGPDWSQPADGLLGIEYLPGVKVSRMEGGRDVFRLVVFIAMGGILVFFTVKTWREAYTE